MSAPRATFSTAKPTGGVSEPTRVRDLADIDERQLLCAIHVLDDSVKASSGVDSVRAVCRALGFLLELTSSVNGGEVRAIDKQPNLSSPQSNKATICAARVLGCLKRFVASSEHAFSSVDRFDRPAKCDADYCRDIECHSSLVCLAVLLVIFNLSQSRKTAAAVVAEGFDMFLLQMAQVDSCVEKNTRLSHHTCAGVEATDYEYTIPEHSSSRAASQADQHHEMPQPEDCLIAIDPFDWCFEALSIDLTHAIDREPPSQLNTHPTDAIFLLPVGERTLCHLLDGVPLPTDEVQEHSRRLERIPVTCARCSRRKRSPQKQKPRRLPSIFSFPSVIDGEDTKQRRILCLGTRESQASGDVFTDRARAVAMSKGARIHLALRSLIALALHLPERSPERREMARRCQSTLVAIQRKYAKDMRYPAKKQDSVFPCDDELQDCHELPSELPLQLPPHQAVAIGKRVLAQLSEIALLVVSRVGQHLASAETTRDSMRRAKRIPCVIDAKPQTRSPSRSEPISIRLEEAAMKARLESAIWREKAAKLNALSERAYRRNRIQQAIIRLEQVRHSLAQGLEILRSGRTHPDLAQSFTDWILSLPTVESHERECQAAKDTRQRLELERQYQADARRRREQDERTLMSVNDSDIANDMEIFAQADKQTHFLEMQAELRNLESTLDVVDKQAAGLLTKLNPESPLSEKEREKQLAKQQRERAELERLQLMRQQEWEARECHLMRTEDVFFAERALRQQEQARRQQANEEANKQVAQEQAMKMQQTKIDEMRARDLDAKRSGQEVERMRIEELLSRQLRFFLAEQTKIERQREQTARKRMQTEEQDSRWRWQLLARAAVQQEEIERKRKRAEDRRARRQKQPIQIETTSQSFGADRGVWTQCWDESGNAYYYNSQTGLSQWEVPTWS